MEVEPGLQDGETCELRECFLACSSSPATAELAAAKVSHCEVSWRDLLNIWGFLLFPAADIETKDRWRGFLQVSPHRGQIGVLRSCGKHFQNRQKQKSPSSIIRNISFRAEGNLILRNMYASIFQQQLFEHMMEHFAQTTIFACEETF